MRTVTLAGLFTVLALASAQAGPQYIDGSGYAVGGYDPVAYFDLEQAPVGGEQPEAVPGREDITAEYNGATWAFASEANREAFLANPEKYAPAYDGHCAYGVAQGGKVPGNPNLWRIIDGTLYLNITPQVVDFWEEDIAGNLDASRSNWADLETETASDRRWKAINANDGTYSVAAPVSE